MGEGDNHCTEKMFGQSDGLETLYQDTWAFRHSILIIMCINHYPANICNDWLGVLVAWMRCTKSPSLASILQSD